jgi:hypothetical protein
LGALRLAMPLVQRLLPLLDGNVGSAVSNLMNPHPTSLPSPPPVNLLPIEDGLSELQAEHRDLCTQVVQQNESLKRVEDQLELASQAADRNAVALQECTSELQTIGNKMDALKAAGRKANLITLTALVLLALSFALNVLILWHFRYFLP